MFSTTIRPRNKRVTIEIPSSYVNHTIEVNVTPVDGEPRHTLKDVKEFCNRFMGDASLLKYTRDELYER